MWCVASLHITFIYFVSTLLHAIGPNIFGFNFYLEKNSAIANEFTIFKIFLTPNCTTSTKSWASLQISFNQRFQVGGWGFPWVALLFLTGMSMISNSIDHLHCWLRLKAFSGLFFSLTLIILMRTAEDKMCLQWREQNAPQSHERARTYGLELNVGFIFMIGIKGHILFFLFRISFAFGCLRFEVLFKLFFPLISGISKELGYGSHSRS